MGVTVAKSKASVKMGPRFRMKNGGPGYRTALCQKSKGVLERGLHGEPDSEPIGQEEADADPLDALVVVQ
jgi:hypothetical protein